jgi:glycosyltransferase involved in cell wall biosynthesis
MSNRADSLLQPLAVVLPAFRTRHLGAALDSLARQTDCRFKLYIGDDCSPEPIANLVGSYTDKIALEYTRFENNLGGSDLIAHWHRCIALSRGEPWIWVFSDDDIASPECVAGFLNCVGSNGETGTQLYRFQMDFIDDAGSAYFRPRPHPAFEDVVQFTAALLRDQRRAWRAPDHIFSRRVYVETGGFVSLPKAIYSDYATWQKFSKSEGVSTIPDGRVFWRHHRKGTSSGMREQHRRAWHRSAQEYVKWMFEFAKGNEPLQRLLAKHGRDWFYRQYVFFRPRLSPAETDAVVRFAAETFGVSHARARIGWHMAFYRDRLRQKLTVKRRRIGP